MKQLGYKLLLCIMFLAAFTAGGQTTDVLHLKSQVSDTFFGTVVDDPYRWMEDNESDSLNRWLKEQKKISKAEQKKFNGRMGDVSYNARANANYDRPWVEKTGGRFFAFGGGGVLYSRRSVNENYRIAFNPHEVDWKLKLYIGFWSVSDSSHYLAVVLNEEGSDWQQIRVSDADSSLYFADKIEHVKVSQVIWWQHGFFYSVYPDGGQWDTTGMQKLYYHRLGQTQDKDELISTSHNGVGYRDMSIWLTSNKRYLIINKNQKIGRKYFAVMAYKDLGDGTDAEWKHIVRIPVEDTCYYHLVDYADSGFILQSNYQAPHGRILLASMQQVNTFTELVHETDQVIKQVTYVHHQLVTLYCTDGQYAIYMYNDTGGLVNGIKFASALTVDGFRGMPDDTEMFFYQHSFYTPTVVYRYSFNTRKYAPKDETKISFNPADYTTDIVHYTTADGTDIPMYISYKRGLHLKGNNPVILKCAGGFNLSVTPTYNYSNIIFFESGGILAVPMLRGGGEEGSDWHAAGRRMNKQTTFNDFADAAKFLIAERYTSKDRLALEGTGIGGLVVAAVMVQHPDLCKVVVAKAGIYDMLRFNKFTDGKYWTLEFGNPENPLDFKNLFSYSPLHNLKPHTNYPATLLIADRKDERVVPMHTFKFLARLQEYSTPQNPHILYFVEDPERRKTFDFFVHDDESAFTLAFIFTQMNLPIKYMF